MKLPSVVPQSSTRKDLNATVSATAGGSASTAAESTAVPSGVLPSRAVPRILAIAGSDPSGGAGIQADLKSIAALGGYGMAAITALTAQNTMGVSSIHIPPAEFLTAQLVAISTDIVIDAVKIGMLGDRSALSAVRAWLEETRPGLVVLDPVMVATSGDRLLQECAAEDLRALLPLADLVTPNLAELALLLGEAETPRWPVALDQAVRLAAVSGTTVLVKGGHLTGLECPDALVTPDGEVLEIQGRRVDTRNSHGTGCSLSSAMATVRAQGGSWEDALRRVKTWLAGALDSADSLAVGSGNGPINHFHHQQPAAADAATIVAAALSSDVLPWITAIRELDFIKSLSAGTLSEQQFGYYLAQDAIYLSSYARVLAKTSALAPSEAEQLFWARASQNCLQVESELHRSWLGARSGADVPGPVTKSYVDHLLAASSQGTYAVLVAAVLPCFWLYAEVGAALHREFTDAGSPSAHPYAGWLRTYADEAFAADTRTAITYATAAGAAGSDLERAAMRSAFRYSCQFEVEFFDAPRVFA